MAERVFVMPDPGEGLEEGRIVEWLVREGDVVELNQPIVEVETAKAAVEIPSPFAGSIVRLHGAEGDDIAVGAPLVTFEVDGEPREPAEAPSPVKASVSPVPARVERHGPEGPARATPVVRRLAKERGVDIEGIRGTGRDGRITEIDVLRAAEPRAEVVEGEPFAVNVHDDLRLERRPVDGARRQIATTLSGQAAIPHVTTFRTVDCTALDAFRRDLGVSPLPVVVAALCPTLEVHPLLNARWVDDSIDVYGKVNVAIATDTDRGLMVPVLQDAGRRGIGDIAGEIRRLADGARSGTLDLADTVATATFAVSNTGSYGSEAGTPILSPGTSATLAIGVIAPRALVVDGEVVARPACTLSLTFDHRVLDGAAAGRFLTDLVAVLQTPERLRDLPR